MKNREIIERILNAIYIRPHLIKQFADILGVDWQKIQEVVQIADLTEYRNHYYEVRTKGDGEFEYFVIPPDDEENEYDPKDEQSAIKAARNHGFQVVKVTEEEIPYQ